MLLEPTRRRQQPNKSNKIKSNKRNKKKKRYDRANPFNDLFYWAREVRIIYNHSCAYCGSHKLSTHHIFYKSRWPGLKYNLNNGICLCLKCHIEVHKLNDIINTNSNNQ
jgi:5-methylcytosine-specific restriction endonuclease McrA